ncbi:MAG: DUF4344 domain-containing metallopeptidase [Pseudomonadota bacterium]
MLPLWWLSLSSPAVHAEDAYSVAWSDQEDLAAFDDRTLFVIGNTLFTAYHELGHALIDLLKLPVIGREEDAVDGFAAVTMIPEEPDDVRDALIVAVGDGWHAQSAVAARQGERPFWGEHALDAQRHFAIVCLMVGSDQDGFYDYALESGLPDERIESCAYDFTRMKQGWKRLLAPHKRSAQTKSEPAAQAAIDIVFDDPLPKQEQAYNRVREHGLLEDAILYLADDIILPTPLTVRFTPCEDANAYWSRSQREVLICYELIEEFDNILLNAAFR